MLSWDSASCQNFEGLKRCSGLLRAQLKFVVGRNFSAEMETRNLLNPFYKNES